MRLLFICLVIRLAVTSAFADGDCFHAYSMLTRDGRRMVSRVEGTNTVYELVPTNRLPANLPPVREWKLYETCATINDSWGYKPTDQNRKSAETIRANREHLKTIGANYLLNVGPDGLGRIPARSVDILLEAKA